MEAVNEGNGGLLGDFWFDMFSEWSGSEDAEVLSLVLAVLVGLDGCDQQIVSVWAHVYLSSMVRVAIR